MTALAGVSLESLEAAVKTAAVQAELLYVKYPESEIVDKLRRDLESLYQLVHDEVKCWRRAGEDTGR